MGYTIGEMWLPLLLALLVGVMSGCLLYHGCFRRDGELNEELAANRAMLEASRSEIQSLTKLRGTQDARLALLRSLTSDLETIATRREETVFDLRESVFRLTAELERVRSNQIAPQNQPSSHSVSPVMQGSRST